MKHVKGRQILLLGLVALVIVAGYYRWTLESNGDTVPAMTDALPAEEGEGAVPAGASADPNASANPNASGEPAASASPAPEDASKETSGEISSSGGYFAQSKQDRDIARSESMAVFKSVTEDANAGEEAKAEAQEKLALAAEHMAKESTIEGLVKAKGFEDCFVTLDESGANVVVKGNQLEKESVAQIKDIVIAQTGLKAAKIKISNAQENVQAASAGN